MRRLLSIFICLQLSISSGVAQPNQDEQRAKELYAEGKIYFDKEQYQKALSLFEEAYQLSKNPGLLPNIGQCHKELGQNKEAALAFQSFLQSSPDSPYYPEVLALFQEVEAFLPKETPAPPKKPEPVKEPSFLQTYKLPVSFLAVSLGTGAGAMAIRFRLDNSQGQEVGAGPFIARASLAVTADLFLIASGVSFVVAKQKSKKAANK